MNLEEKTLSRLIGIVSVFITIFSVGLIYYSGINSNRSPFILFLVVPMIIIILGKLSDFLIRVFKKAASKTLVFNDYGLFPIIFAYYLALSIFMSFLIGNSVLFSEFELTAWEIPLIALSLAFLPRVLSFTAIHEHTKVALLSILVPLIALALPLIFLKSGEVTFSWEIVRYCFFGSLIFSIAGELWILAAQKSKILIKSPEYQRPGFLNDVRAKPKDQDWKCFIKEFNNPDFEEFRPTIVKAFETGFKESKDYSGLKHEILFALSDLDHSLEDSIKFIDLLKKLGVDEIWGVRAVVAEAIGVIWEVEPDEALLVLKELASDEDEDVRPAVARALGKIGKIRSNEALLILKQLAKDKYWRVGRAVAEALGEIGTVEPGKSITVLKELAGDENWTVREVVASALGTIGKVKPDKSLSILKELAVDEDKFVREAVVGALEEIGKAKPGEALLILKIWAGDKDADVRRAVAKALEEIGKIRPDEALLILKRLAKDEDEDVRRYVSYALGRLAWLNPLKHLDLSL